jgi:hypothetical protein
MGGICGTYGGKKDFLGKPESEKPLGILRCRVKANVKGCLEYGKCGIF